MTHDELLSLSVSYRRADFMFALYDKIIKESETLPRDDSFMNHPASIALFFACSTLYEIVKFLGKKNALPPHCTVTVKVTKNHLRKFRNAVFHVPDKYHNEDPKKDPWSIMLLPNALRDIRDLQRQIGDFLVSELKKP